MQLEVVGLVQGRRRVAVDDGTETVPLSSTKVTKLALQLGHCHDAFVEFGYFLLVTFAPQIIGDCSAYAHKPFPSAKI